MCVYTCQSLPGKVFDSHSNDIISFCPFHEDHFDFKAVEDSENLKKLWWVEMLEDLWWGLGNHLQKSRWSQNNF